MYPELLPPTSARQKADISGELSQVRATVSNGRISVRHILGLMCSALHKTDYVDQLIMWI